MAALVDQSQSTTIDEYLQSARDEGAEIFQPDIEVSDLYSNCILLISSCHKMVFIANRL